jgi:flagellar export protein FliJ
VRPPRYPLQAVLEQRGAAREEARLRLAEAIRELEERERERGGAEAKLAALDAERGELTGHLYDPDERGLLPIPLVERRTDELRNVEGQLREAEHAVAACREAVERAVARVDECRGLLVEADRDLKAAEKHHEAWRAEWQREQTRKEQRLSEEVTLARFAAEAAGDGGPERGNP